MEVIALAAAAVGPIAYFFSLDGIASLSEASVPNIVYRRVGSDVFTVTMMVRMAGINLLGVGLLVFPLTFAIAIMRLRLWDIGVVVNRTLVYGALTANIVAAYLISVLLLQLAFRAVTDQGGTVASSSRRWLSPRSSSRSGGGSNVSSTGDSTAGITMLRRLWPGSPTP